MSRPDNGEVATVESADLRLVEALRECDHACVHHSEPEIGVLPEASAAARPSVERPSPTRGPRERRRVSLFLYGFLEKGGEGYAATARLTPEGVQRPLVGRD